MRIQLKGRGGKAADEELFSRVEKKLGKVARQVSPLAELTIELREERGEQVADGALRLKGVTLRARERASDAGQALNLMAEDLARQVKKHRDKRRARREAHRAAAQQHAV
ncbi:MAG TPA: HPF/RaiA family ribosome-associated protein [Thermoleophilaceae bacterium]|jgi:putative sigma-54 modulation protein|nr:HPF/RaiA family ribosome-associated protein [Thermoleophilaceae bacterium]